jgi:hypothetical protein
MIVRDGRTVEAVPGRSSAGATAFAVRRMLGRICYSCTRRSIVVTISVFCVSILLVTSLPSAAASTPGSPPPPAGTPNSTLDYVYDVSPSLYPSPSTLASPSATGLIKMVALPSTATSFGMINTSSSESGSGILWYESGGYSAGTAASLQTRNCSTSSCSAGVPIQWNAPAKITFVSRSISSDALAVVGGNLVAASSSGGSTQLYESANLGASWTALGPTLSGVIASLGSNSTEVSVVTDSSGTWYASVVNVTGAVEGPVTLTPTGSGAQGILAAASTFVTGATSSSVVVMFSVIGSNQVEMVTSANGGATFSTAQAIGSYASAVPNPSFSSVGDTRLYAPNAVAGQIGLVSLQSGLFVVYTTLLAGQVVLTTESSAGVGSPWQGPYSSSPVTGAVQNLTVSSSPSGLVYTTWTNPDGGMGNIQEAIFFADGTPMTVPTPLPGSGLPGFSPAGGSAVAVDAFQQPLVAWSSLTGGVGSISFTGDFLSANGTLSLVDQMVMDPLTGGDFSGVVSPPSQAAFNTSVATAVSTISGSLATDKVCNAQNESVMELYSNLTHVALNITPGSGTICAKSLTPNNKTSPLTPTIGMDAPNTFLAVYVDWLLESLGVPVAVSPLSLVLIGGVTFSNLIPVLPQPISKSTPVFNQTEVISLNPTAYSPTSLDLSVFSLFVPYWYASGTPECGTPGHFTNCPINTHPSCFATDAVTAAFANISINSGLTKSFRGTFSYPSVYITNLTPDVTYSWSETFTARYTESFVLYNATGCTPPSGWPTATTPITFTGSLTTLLSISSQLDYLNANYVEGSSTVTGTFRFDWTNSMQSTASATLADVTSGGPPSSWSSASYSLGETSRFPIAGKVGDQYEATFGAASRTGGWTSAQAPAYGYGSYGSSPAQTASASYPFTLTRPAVTFWGFGVTNITPTTSQITWYATSASAESLTYYLVGTGVNQTITGVPDVELANQTSTRFTVVLHGLEAWSLYSTSCAVIVSGTSYTDTVTQALPSFHTAPALTVSEVDLPYDSVTGTGGGAQIHWDVPASFESQTPTPEVTSGLVTIWNSTANWLVPISPQEINQTRGSQWFDVFNLTLFGLNATYGLTLELNYSTSPAVTAVSPVLTFVYQKDSSGDGLTDLEKEDGWGVTITEISGIAYTFPVTASPSLYSTNGLVSDFVEKEFDLDPNVVDTAASYMLDTWNLTFSLAGDGGAIPSEFHIWYENTTYNPFATSVQYAPGAFETGSPAAYNITNISASPAYGITSGDGSSHAATYLWSFSALLSFDNLAGFPDHCSAYGSCWLRAVEGSWKGIPTLTVWGKLSWGADPLVTSTPNDGLADGVRVNPLYDEGLELNFASLGSGHLGEFGLTACGNVPKGAGVALSLSIRGAAQGSLATYSSQFVSTCPKAASTTTYTLTLPMTQTAQSQSVTLQMIANESTTNSPDSVALPINGCSTSQTFSVGMLNATPLFNSAGGAETVLEGNPAGSCTGAGGVETITAFGATEVPYGVKAPTWLWVPTDNSSLGNLPPGLQRYSAEQDFALIVVNDTSGLTSPTTSETIPYPWSTPIWNPRTGYSISINPGLSNIIVPRGQFFNSTLGRSVLLGTIFPQFYSSPSPLLGSNENASIVNFGMSSPLSRLSCYWQNRAIYSGGASTLGCSAFTGTGNASWNAISVMADTNSSTATNGGGVPSNPSLESASEAGASLQVVVRVGVNTTTQLDLLLAALLDNSTGGVNGTLESVTYAIPSLGFSSALLQGLANQTYTSGGLWGVPASKAVAETSGCGSIWSFLSNNPGGTLSCIVSGVANWVGEVWTLATAAADYITHPYRLFLLGEQLDQRVGSAITTGGKVLAGAIERLASFVITEIEAILHPLFAPIVRGAETYTEDLAQNLWAVANDTAADRSAATDIARFWFNVSGPVFYLALIAGIGITIVFTVIEALSLGSAFLIPLVIGLLISGAWAATAEKGGPSLVSALRNVNPLTPPVANDLEAVVGGSKGQEGADFAALAAILGTVTTSVAASYVFAAWSSHQVPQFTDSVGAALGIIAIFVGGTAAAIDSLAGTIVSFLFDGDSVILDVIASINDLTLENIVIFLLDVCAAGLDGAALAVET